MRRLLGLTFLLAVLTPSAASADDESDRYALAAQFQMSAIEAMTAGDWDAAEDRARAALSVEASVRTSQARLVLARALEQKGDVRGALAELNILLAMELLPQHRQKAEEAQGRLEPRSGPALIPPPEPPPMLTPSPEPDRKALGIALAVGGAAPVGLGITFIGFDAHFASQGIESGGWAILGASLLGAGIALEVIGVHLILTEKEQLGGPTASRLRWTPSAGLAVTPEATSLQLGVFGRW